METANLALTARWFEEVWNQGREETIDELFALEGVGYGLGDQDAVVRGPEQFKAFVRNMRGSFPDLHIHVEDAIASGDKVAIRVSLQGTHAGPGLGVTPTDARVQIAGMVLVRFANGQIVEGWNSWDQLGLLRQIGALGLPLEPDRFLTAP